MIDRELSILESVRVMCRVPGVYELRCLEHTTDGRWPKTVSGYFDDLDALALAAENYDGSCKGVYLTLNPVIPDLLARAENRARDNVKDGDLTKDQHVLCRVWLPLDFDPVRVSGVSSTDAEHALALERARECRDWLAAELGWPAPVSGDSGNGGHLDYAIDLPNDDKSRDLVHACLRAVKARFSDPAVKGDESNFNAARIWKLYGTLARKGDDARDRPHRRSRILEVPELLEVVTAEKLAALAALAGRAETGRKTPTSGSVATPVAESPTGFDMPAFLERHGLKVRREKTLADGRLWELERCLFDESHAAPDACVMVRDGKPCYKCFHDSCARYGWKEFRARLEADQPDSAGGSGAGCGGDQEETDRRAGRSRGREDSDSRRLLAAALEHGEPFTSPEQVAHVRRRDDRGGEVVRVQSHLCKRWLAGLARRLGFVASQKAVSDTLLALEGACFDAGDVRKVHLRVARLPDALYLDLADAGGRVVKVTRAGWEVVVRPPVVFARSPNMASLPLPERGGGWDEFRRLLNVADEEWPLVRGWMLDCLKGCGPYTVLLVGGEQGSAKSTLSKAVRQAIDPVHRAPARRLQRDEYELAIAARMNALLVFDNVSSLPQWLSDAIASLATGAGFAVRTLYSQDDETVYGDARPVCFNGIPDFAESADLLDRAIRVTCPRIPAGRRMDEDAWDPAFEAARPRLLGLLLDCVSSGLRHLGDVDLPCPPRMARSARWIAACEACLPAGEPRFVDAYERNRADTNALAIDGSPTAIAILDWLDGRRGRAWEGTASQLHDELLGVISGLVAHSGGFPKAANKLSGELRRLAPVLAKAGVAVAVGRSKRGSKVRVERVTVGDDTGQGVTIPDAPAVPPPAEQAAEDDHGGDRKPSPPPPTVTRIVTPQLPGFQGVHSAGDDGDDSSRSSSPRKEEGVEAEVEGRGVEVCEGSSPPSPIVTPCRRAGETFGDWAGRVFDPRDHELYAVRSHWNTCGCGKAGNDPGRWTFRRRPAMEHAAGGTAA